MYFKLYICYLYCGVKGYVLNLEGMIENQMLCKELQENCGDLCLNHLRVLVS